MGQGKTPSIEDRLAIHDLLARYAWALDTGDVDGMIDCFTPDGVVIEDVFEDPDIWEGHEGIRRFARHYFSAPGFAGRQHHVSQIQIATESADRCHVRCFAFVTECRGEPPYSLRFAGYYEDWVVKQADTWRFTKRLIRLWEGPILKLFPGQDGKRVGHKRPPELFIKDRS